MTMRKILIVAFMFTPVAGLASEVEYDQELEIQMHSEEYLEAPIDFDTSTVFSSNVTCGDAKMSAFYEEARIGFLDEPSGKVDLTYGTTKVATRFTDVSCLDGTPLIQFENGGTIRLTSYFGSFLPTPTGGVVQAYYGNLNIPGVFALDGARFWLNSQGDLFGLLISGPTFFQMSSKWWAP